MAKSDPSVLSGRIQANPHQLMHEEILEKQFEFEVENLLPHYIWIEKVLLIEYRRMGLISKEEAVEISGVLDRINVHTLKADPKVNMSDIAFAMERVVLQHLGGRAPAWHADRSRNDLQACAQLMWGRSVLLDTVEEMKMFFNAVHQLATRTVDIPMPGLTHYQTAQVITPGFYFSSISETLLESLKQLLSVYDGINRSPLGAGAMAGQELEWDLEGLAHLLGFRAPVPHALMGVASRDWRLKIASEWSQLGSSLSRFASDLILWGSGGYGFIDLPDELSGISSAMPQKKNFPVLERIRGKTAHLHAFYLDLILGNRNTAYTNLVETSKEAGTHFSTLCQTMRSVLRIFTVVVDGLSFREDRMRSVCEQEYTGGSALANFLTLSFQIPYREAQVITGKYISACMEKGLTPQQPSSSLLRAISREYGYEVQASREQIRERFGIRHNLYGKQSSNSTSPLAVRQILKQQEKAFNRNISEWEGRRRKVEDALQQSERLFQ